MTWDWFRGGLVFKAHRWLYHSTLGSRVIKKRRRDCKQCRGALSETVPLALGDFPNSGLEQKIPKVDFVAKICQKWLSASRQRDADRLNRLGPFSGFVPSHRASGSAGPGTRRTLRAWRIAPLRVVHLGRSTCHAISGRGDSYPPPATSAWRRRARGQVVRNERESIPTARTLDPGPNRRYLENEKGGARSAWRVL